MAEEEVFMGNDVLQLPILFGIAFVDGGSDDTDHLPLVSDCGLGSSCVYSGGKARCNRDAICG